MEASEASTSSENVFPTPKKRRRIKLVYSNEKKTKSKCNVCSKRLTKGGLAHHFQSYHSNVAYQCSICDKGFTRITNVKQHIRKMHPGMDQDWYKKCRKDELPAHVFEDMQNRLRTSISGAVPLKYPKITVFNCYDCDGSFPSVQELFTHCETHRVSETGEKFPYLVKTTKRWSNSHLRWVHK